MVVWCDLISQYLDELGQKPFPNGMEVARLNIPSVAEGILENTMPMVTKKSTQERQDISKLKREMSEFGLIREAGY